MMVSIADIYKDIEALLHDTIHGNKVMWRLCHETSGKKDGTVEPDRLSASGGTQGEPWKSLVRVDLRIAASCGSSRA
jgi:hypothetical protein